MDDGAFRSWVVTVAPGCERAYSEAEWRDALVVLQQGDIDLVGITGTRRTFRRGSVLWLEGLPLRALENPGLEDARLVAVRRRPPAAGDAAAAS